MVDDFAAAVAAWQPFYSLAGSAAFTILGLVFVAVSINIGMIAMADKQGDLVQFARQTLNSFLMVMIIALVFYDSRTGTAWNRHTASFHRIADDLALSKAMEEVSA